MLFFAMAVEITAVDCDTPCGLCAGSSQRVTRASGKEELERRDGVREVHLAVGLPVKEVPFSRR